ncbi:MAG: insulinase family protein [Parachlamydia sp.]|nr:insulinase family protein [Parachlamydia sp.]
MLTRFFVSILVTMVFVSAAGESPIESPIREQSTYQPLGITQIILNNGMRFCLKPTNFEEDEVLIRLTASGGYAALPAAQRAAGELSAQMAWESGLEGMSTDKLTALIYEHSIELYAKVLPYHRILEGTTEAGGIKVFFDLVKGYSAEKKLTREGFDRISKVARELVRLREQARSSPAEEWSRLVHTQDVAALRPLTLQDLNSMEFARAKQFFEEYFTNPADFVCVVVGNFKVEEIVPLLVEDFGDIPSKGPTQLSAAEPPAFPDRTFTKRIPAPGSKECLARLTFPLASIENPQQLRMASLMAQVLDTRLRSLASQGIGGLQEIASSLELPLYPDLTLTWLAIQFRCPPHKVEMVQKAVSAEIKKMLAEGPSEAELAGGWKQFRQKEGLWHHDNQYWLSALSDYFLRGWEWDELRKTVEVEAPPTARQFRQSIQTIIEPDRYTFVYLTP